MGGKVAQLMASRRHKGLAGLVLVAPSPPQPMTRPPEAREQMAGAYSTRESVSATIDHVLTAKVLSPTDREQVIEDSLSGAPPAKVAWPRSTGLEGITSEVGNINVPTIVISGEHDRVDSVEMLKAELLPRIAHAVLHVVPATGHLSPLESPHDLGRLISDFAAACGSNNLTSSAELANTTTGSREGPEHLA